MPHVNTVLWITWTFTAIITMILMECLRIAGRITVESVSCAAKLYVQYEKFPDWVIRPKWISRDLPDMGGSTIVLTEEMMFLLSLSEWLAADFAIIATHSSRDREPSGLLRLTD